MSSAPQYYRPYESENEDTDNDDVSEDTDDYDSEDLPNFEDARIRREQDPRYAIIRAAGPNFNTVSDQLAYQAHTDASNYLISTNASDLNNSLLYNQPATTTQTSLFTLKSSNRDKSVYTSASNFSIKLPRVYKNVTKLQLVQLSYPNFVNTVTDISGFISSVVQIISPIVGSTCIQSCLNVFNGTTPFTTVAKYEANRKNENGADIYTSVSVPPGAYTGKSLAAELNRQSNKTPIFNIISYDDFKTSYKLTLDHLLIFNEPGDYHHSHVTGKITNNPTKEFMANHYYSNNVFHNILEPNDGHALTTYYYPVLKEYLASGQGIHVLNKMGLSNEVFLNSTLHNFLGIDSPFLQSTISSNILQLDNYRKFHTFEKSPVNKYFWSYNDKINQFSVTHNELNTSLQNDIKYSYSTFYINELTNKGLNSNSFASLYKTHQQHNLVFNGIYTYMSTILKNIYNMNYMFNPYGIFQFTTDYNFDGNNDTIHDIYNNGTTGPVTQHTELNNQCNIVSTFGSGVINTFAGITVTSNHFSSLYSSMTGYHTSKSIALSTISSVNNNTLNSYHNYVATKYATTLPADYLTTKSYMNYSPLPVTFITNKSLYISGSEVNDTNGDDCYSTCKKLIESFINNYYACLPTNTIINSLAYKLGIWNPTSISNLSVISTLGNFNAFNNFNLLMQINTEQSFNNMDIAMNEDYKRNNETTGQTKLIAAKILTSGLGSNDISQTVIQNPIIFDGTLGKLDKLTFRILIDDDALTPLDLFFPFDLPFTNWDATFQIDEEVGMADKSNIFNQTPSINIPSNRRPI